jgi:outer membrane protein OmpA-like peptidoglycan-associated protein
LSASIVLLADRLSGPGRSPATLAAVAFLALAVLWIALWVLDFLYYNRLLLGAVDEIVRVEKETQFSNKIGRLAFSETVKNAVEAPVFPKRDDNTADKSAELTEEGKKRSMWRKSQRGPRYFYAIVLVSLLLLSFLSYFSGRGQASPPPTGPDKPGPNGGAPPCSPCATPCSPCTTPVPSQQAGQTTSLTPPVPIPEVVQRWEQLKKTDPLTNVASIINDGARLLQPLLEKTGETASQALELGKAFFQHFAESAGDEAGKRAVEAVFGYFSGTDKPGSPATDPKQATRTFSMRRAIVRFDLDRAVIPPSGQNTLRELLSAVPSGNGFWLLVASTDRSGSGVRNSKLSNDRWRVVEQYLVEHKVNPRVIAHRTLSEITAPVPGYDGGRDPENRTTEVFLLVVDPG